MKQIEAQSSRADLYVEDVPLVEFMYLVFARTPGGSYRKVTQVFVVVLVLRISSGN